MTQSNTTVPGYEKVVPLMKEAHRDWVLDTSTACTFGRDTNAVLLLGSEFRRAAREYPIVFVSQGETVQPVAVLGLTDAQNLFVGDDGKWNAAYVPAAIRRYPFILANNGKDGYTVCIDEGFAGLNKEKGEPLFLENGDESPYLKRSVQFLKDFQGDHEFTGKFAAHLKELGLLDPIQANVELNNGEKMSLTGFLVVKRERLAELSPDVLAELLKSGHLDLIYAHLFSLDNFAALVDRLGSRQPNA